MKVGALAMMAAFLLVGGISLSAQAGPALDSDSDGTYDINDLCSMDPLVPSSCSFDNDNDGFGNKCDGDFNNDGATNPSDVAVFAGFLGGGGPSPGDMNCDGATNPSDVSFFATQLGAGAPGPSGLPCAGTIPCP